MNWDFLLSWGIIIVFFLFIFSRIIHMSIKEMLQEIKDFFTGTKEDLQEKIEVYE